MGICMIFLIILLILIAVVAVIFYFSIYNRLVALKNNIEKSWSNIDVLLKQRHDELPKLLETVKGYMKYEKDVLTQVTEARTAFMQARSVHDKAVADNMLTGALKTLFAVSENYPQLKANDNFIQLQHRISDLENQIADRREFYNDSVNTYNIRIESIPDSIIARRMNLQRREMFKVADADRQDVQIKFD